MIMFWQIEGLICRELITGGGGRALTWDLMVNNSHNLKMRYKNCDIVTDQNNKTEGIQSSNRQCCAYFELPPTLLEATFSLLRELYSRTEEII